MRQYTLVTHWNLGAPVERIWDALVAAEEWPRWWRYVQAVDPVAKGDAHGIGTIRRYTWSSRLPYRLSFEMRTTALTHPTFIEGVAAGDLNGIGRWRISRLGNNARVRYEWTVTTGKRWMNLLAPVLAPVFAWNHDQVMQEGGRGIARHLGVALLAFEGSSDGPRAQ